MKMNKKTAAAAVCTLVVFLLFCFFHYLSPFIYQTNDDLFLRMIASGEMSGEAESRLHYISYPAGLLISTLYRLIPFLPWYGLSLYVMFGLAMTVMLYLSVQSGKNLLQRLLIICFFCLFSYGFLFPCASLLQYTIVTGLTGCGALFLFLHAPLSSSFRETLKNHLLFFIFSACTFCIRNQVFFMFLPFFGMIALSKYLDAEKKQRKNLLYLAGIFILLSTSLLVLEKTVYRQEVWRNFTEYTKARTTIYDYEGYPDYDKYEETYRELGISRSSYEGASRRYSLILDPAINRHSMEVLESISKQERHDSMGSFSQKASEMITFFLERHRSDADKPLNLLVYRCYFFFILCALLSRKWRALRDIFFLLSARMVIWAYLIFYGRLPVRISQTVYLAELAVLFAVAFTYKIWQTTKKEDLSGQKLSRAAWILSIFVIAFTCVRSGIPHANAVSGEAKALLEFSDSFRYMKDYFKEHPDSFYYLDTNSFAYFTEEALCDESYVNSNYLFMGGWAAKSPWYEKKLEKQDITDPALSLCEDPSVYAVFMDTEETNYEYLENFYAENYPGVRLRVVETVDTKNGISFLILKGYPEEAP